MNTNNTANNINNKEARPETRLSRENGGAARRSAAGTIAWACAWMWFLEHGESETIPHGNGSIM